ncbi:hypothetical protein HPB50_016755 [Hyalomma asiaticum]|uniref:Uncharacterized protein n=1 Tax=Hyalomma asiaticum TaxID=266040 RepID=A0ACB7S320_HYAAI|nr:hypothetical protein HPB50_016755 [Hyalomma asiaticum]
MRLFFTAGIRGAERAAEDMNIRNGVKSEYKLESRRLSHDVDHDNAGFCNGHVRTERSADTAKHQQLFSNGTSCHSPETGSRRASVVCYRDGEECVFRKGSCYSENCAAITDENLNESSAVRLKPDDDCPSRRKRSFVAIAEEPLLSTFKQAAVPFFLGGLGTVFAGLILDTVQFWPPFEHVTELFIVVPPLLGLKAIPTAFFIKKCQACVLSLLSSVFAIVMGLASDDHFRIDQALFVASSSMATAAVASFLLGTVMVLVVAYSNRCHINPDNVATSVVDALGDMTTLAILAGFSTLLYGHISKPWIASVFGATLVLLCPAWVYLARGHPTSRKVLAVGWWPIIVAMIISRCGLLVVLWRRVYFPMFERVNGNLAAIHASRLSTLFAQRSELGYHPEDDKRHCVDPLTGLCGRNRQARVSQLLLLLSIPGHVLFVLLIFVISDAHVRLTVALMFSYLVASLVLLTVLLYLARCGAYWMWRRKIDPDNALIPLLTGFGDLCGTGFLLVAFLFLESIQDASVAGFVGASSLAANGTATS